MCKNTKNSQESFEWVFLLMQHSLPLLLSMFIRLFRWCSMTVSYKTITLTELSFFHLWRRPRMPEVTDNSPSDGGYEGKIEGKIHKNVIIILLLKWIWNR